MILEDIVESTKERVETNKKRHSIYELKEKREKGNIVIGYWQIKNMIEEIIKQCKIN